MSLPISPQEETPPITSNEIGFSDELSIFGNAVKDELMDSIMLFIPNDLLKPLQNMNVQILFKYIQKSMILQLSDKQIKQFKVRINAQTQIISIIHFDFRVKKTNEFLYGILINQNKWELHEFLTIKQILNKYDIKQKELPQSSRKMDAFINQMQQRLNMNAVQHIIDQTNWYKVDINLSSTAHSVSSGSSASIQITPKMWQFECKKSFKNKDLPLIPVVVSKHNKHWIEWVKIICISSETGPCFFGLSCKYVKNEWSVHSIYLDIDDIYNDHQLIGLHENKYCDKLKEYKSIITSIEFKQNIDDDNNNNNIDNKINEYNLLKQQILSNEQQIDELQQEQWSLNEPDQKLNILPVVNDVIDGDINNNDDVYIYSDTGLELPDDW